MVKNGGVCLKINGKIEEIVGSLKSLVYCPNQHFLVISIRYIPDHKRLFPGLIHRTQIDDILPRIHLSLIVLLLITISLHPAGLGSIILIHVYLVQVFHSCLLLEVKLVLKVPVHWVKILELA